jgi:hypothetical protein
MVTGTQVSIFYFLFFAKWGSYWRRTETLPMGLRRPVRSLRRAAARVVDIGARPVPDRSESGKPCDDVILISGAKKKKR